MTAVAAKVVLNTFNTSLGPPNSWPSRARHMTSNARWDGRYIQTNDIYPRLHAPFLAVFCLSQFTCR